MIKVKWNCAVFEGPGWLLCNRTSLLSSSLELCHYHHVQWTKTQLNTWKFCQTVCNQAHFSNFSSFEHVSKCRTKINLLFQHFWTNLAGIYSLSEIHRKFHLKAIKLSPEIWCSLHLMNWVNVFLMKPKGRLPYWCRCDSSEATNFREFLDLIPLYLHLSPYVGVNELPQNFLGKVKILLKFSVLAIGKIAPWHRYIVRRHWYLKTQKTSL